MKNNPLISVILPVYNSANYILECLESIKIQTIQNFELILIDDKSTDKSLEITEDYLKNNLYGKFKIIKNKSNIGITRCLNKAFKISNGKYIARIDADDINKPDRFKIQFKYLERNNDISIVGSNVEYIDKKSKFIQHSDLPLSHVDIKSSLFLYNPMVHSTIFFRKKVFIKYPYNEKFYTTQDYEMYCRIINYYKIANIKKPLAKYRIHNQTVSKKKYGLQKKNTLLIQKKIYTQNFDNYFPLKKFKLFNNFFMADYNHIKKNVRNFNMFLLEMFDLLDNLKRKIKNKNLDYFFLERLLIFFKNSSEHKFYILKIVFEKFDLKDILIISFDLVLKKFRDKFFILMNNIKF